MVDNPARVHCDADALKSFVTHIKSKLYVSEAKRVPCTQSTWHLLLAGPKLFQKVCHRYSNHLFLFLRMFLEGSWLSWLKDPVVNEVFSYFKQYWPNTPATTPVEYPDPEQVEGDRSKDETENGTVNASDGTSASEGDEGCDDLALAEALGVPQGCIERLTPDKKGITTPVADEIEVKHPPPCPPTLAAHDRDLRIKQLQRDIRIKQLQCPALISASQKISYFSKLGVYGLFPSLRSKSFLLPGPPALLRQLVAKHKAKDLRPEVSTALPSTHPDQVQTVPMDMSPIARTFFGPEKVLPGDIGGASSTGGVNDNTDSLLKAPTRRPDSFADPETGDDHAKIDDLLPGDLPEPKPRNLNSVFDEQVGPDLHLIILEAIIS